MNGKESPGWGFGEMKRCSEAVPEMVTMELGFGLKSKAREGVRGHSRLQ